MPCKKKGKQVPMDSPPFTLLWVHDHFGVPINGLAQRGEDKLWFRLQNIPSDYSSVGENEPYEFLRISPEMLHVVERNHQRYCEETGAPLRHGDPIRPRKPPPPPEPTDEVEGPADPSAEGTSTPDDVDKLFSVPVQKFRHSFVPESLYGEIVATATRRDFSNFYVSHRILTDE